MKNRMKALFLAPLMLLALAACGGCAQAKDEDVLTPAEAEQPTEELEPTPEPTPTPVPTPEPEYRLTKIVDEGDEYTFFYGQGGYLPTEILRNGESYKTFSYDEEWRITSYEDSYESNTFVYDENGNLVENITVYYDAGETNSERMIIYAYDDAGNSIRTGVTDADHSTVVQQAYDEMGNCIRGERTDSFTDGTVRTSLSEDIYTYDEAGNCIRREETLQNADGTVWASTYECTYTYDESGNCILKEETYTASDGTVTSSAIQTFDEEGRRLSQVTTGADGKVSAETYAYNEDGRTTIMADNGDMYIKYDIPLLDVDWSRYTSYNGDGTSFTIGTCGVALGDFYSSRFSAGISSDSEPTMTYDENGYLVKVEGSEGETMELTYEPVA